MSLRSLCFCFFLASYLGFGGSAARAQTTPSSNSNLTHDAPVTDGFAKPYEFERQAYGYDPEGIEYKENQAEDFQVVFISSAPFAAAASYGLTGLVSLIVRNQFQINGDYFVPFVAGTVVGATAVAFISVLTNKYPPPPASSAYSEKETELPPLAFKITAWSAEF